jgi:hypothetical protein
VNKIKKPFPNASYTEVMKKATAVPCSNTYYEFGPRKTVLRYKKRNFGYTVEGDEIKAIYLPSMKNKLKIMYFWCPIDKKWMSLDYREGDL